ncbi:hypothetical protein GCM10009579_12530 [Streptomyces javensis]|uniref:Uncharacterized protein n=1 Tax=Streptomyces javensis TaxID=114698 RepID=A0ABP4HCN8_9ACTN
MALRLAVAPAAGSPVHRRGVSRPWRGPPPGAADGATDILAVGVTRGSRGIQVVPESRRVAPACGRVSGGIIGGGDR